MQSLLRSVPKVLIQNSISSSYLFHSHLIDSDSFKQSPSIVHLKIYSNQIIESLDGFVFDVNCVTPLEQWLSQLD